MLLLGMAGIITGTLGIRLAHDASWVKIFDNLHWSAATLSAAVLAWLALRTASPEALASRRWFAIGLTGYAVGQLLWDTQIAIAYTDFPAPSDLFYLWLGPCIAYGLLLELQRLEQPRQHLPALLDVLSLTVALLIMVLALYLPKRGDTPMLPLLVLIIYPVSLFAASCIGLIMTAELRLRLSWPWLMFLLGLAVTGLCWMNWNLMALDGTTTDGAWFNISFSIAVLMMAVGAGLWKTEQSDYVLYDRICEGFLRLLPLFTVLMACLAIILINVLEDVPNVVIRLVEIGAPVVILLAMLKQGLLLREHEQLIKTRAALVREEQFTNDIITSLPGVFCVLDVNGRVTSWNPKFVEVTGYSGHEIAGKNVLTFIHESHRTIVQTKNRKSLREEGVSVEADILCKNGQSIPYYFKARRINQDGQAYFVVLGTDISERVQIEDALRKSELKLKALLDFSGVAIGWANEQGNIEYVNHKFTDLFGYTLEDVPTISDWYQRAYPDVEYREKVVALWMTLAMAAKEGDGRVSPLEINVSCKDGRVRTVILIGSWVDSMLLAIFNDITERKIAEKALLESEQRWSFALEGAGEGVWDWNVKTGHVLFSRRWKEMLGYAEDEFENSMAAWEVHLHPDERPEVLAAIDAYFGDMASVFDIEFRMRAKDGSWKWIQARGKVVSCDAEGKPLRMIGTHVDISEKKKFEKLIWKQANFDLLTQLPNRSMFLDRLSQDLKKAHRSALPLALLFVDLDHFKEVNDTLGHQVGDALLVEAAQRINSCVRDSDTVARLGGDEFTVILSQLPEHSHVAKIAQNIITRLAAPFYLGGEIIHVSASIGITLYPTDGVSVEQLIRNADQAMYEAKGQGRNRFSYFSDKISR